MNKLSVYIKTGLFALAIAFFLTFCQSEPENKVVLAKVYDNYLYLEDIADMLPPDLSPEDSIEVLNSKIDLWVRKQLLLNQANAGLSEEQKDVEQIVKDYRASLLIDKYKQEFLKEKLDTVVDKSEIRAYYTANSESFLLSRKILKGYYLKIPLDHSEFITVRNLAFSANPESADELSDIAQSSDFQYADFRNHWTAFSEYSDRMPQSNLFSGPQLKNRKHLSAQDEQFFYFLKIDDIKLAGEVMPFEQAEEEIKILLINKQKTELLEALERSAYQNALQQGNLEIFTD